VNQSPLCETINRFVHRGSNCISQTTSDYQAGLAIKQARSSNKPGHQTNLVIKQKQ